MATDYLQTLDEAPHPDGNTDWRGGQYSATASGIIPANAYSEGKNVDFDAIGRLVSRRGAKSVVGNTTNQVWEQVSLTWNGSTRIWGSSLSSLFPIDALFYFATNAQQYLLVAQNGAIYQGTESAAYVAVASATYSGSLVYFAQLNNRCYYCDATNALKYVDSSLTFNAITAGRVTSLTPIEEGVGYTTVPAVTLSGAATAIAVLGYGGRVIGYTITAGSTGYTPQPPPTGTVAAAPAGGITATFRINISQTPSKPKFLVTHQSRLVCTTADTTIPQDTVYFSDILDGESWDLIGASLRVGGDGDPITGIYSWFDKTLLVFKQKSVWTIICDPSLATIDWQVRRVTERVGCVAHRSIQAVGADVFFLSRAGIRSLAQIQAGTQNEVGPPTSQPITDIIQDIDLTYADYICSASYKNKYLLAVPTTGNTRPNKTIVWDGFYNSFPGYWTGWLPRDFCITAFSGKIRLAFADGSGRVWNWDDYTPVASESASEYSDDTTDYESYAVTRSYNYGDPLVKKLGSMVQLITENSMSNSGTAYFYYAMDEGAAYTAFSTTIALTAGVKNMPVARNLLPRGKFRNIRFKWGTTAKKMTLTALATTAFPDTLIPELN